MSPEQDALVYACKRLIRRLRAKEKIIAFYRVGTRVQPSESTLREIDATETAEAEAFAAIAALPQ